MPWDMEKVVLKIDFILCTRNRPNAIRMLVNSIGNLENMEIVKVTVVDASDSPLNVSDFDFPNQAQLNVLQTKPGLPSQRNFGLANTDNPIIVFLDDDVILPQNFISETLKAFSEDAQLAGLGYNIGGIRYQNSGKFVSNFIRLNASTFGQVSRSGKNIWYPDNAMHVEKQPMWIPGCAMAYRRSAVINLDFNPNLEKGILGGYALGEDVDFSLRLFRRGGSLRVCTKVTIDHYKAPGERDNHLSLAKAQGAWLKYLSNTFPFYVPATSVFLRLLAEMLYLSFALVVGRTSRSVFIQGAYKFLNFLKPSPYPK